MQRRLAAWLGRDLVPDVRIYGAGSEATGIELRSETAPDRCEIWVSNSGFLPTIFYLRSSEDANDSGAYSTGWNLRGEVVITANDPQEPSSYLTCLQGAPYDGLRCSIKGMMSVDNELIVTATYTTEPPRKRGLHTVCTRDECVDRDSTHR